MARDSRQQGGVHIGDCGAICDKFIAYKLVTTPLPPSQKKKKRRREKKRLSLTDVVGGSFNVMEGNGEMATGRSGCWGSSSLAETQLLRSSSVAVSTSQDFEDKAAITAFLSKPIAQSLSILRV